MRETKQWFQHNNRTLRVGSRGLIYPEGLKGFFSIHENHTGFYGMSSENLDSQNPLRQSTAFVYKSEQRKILEEG